MLSLTEAVVVTNSLAIDAAAMMWEAATVPAAHYLLTLAICWLLVGWSGYADTPTRAAAAVMALAIEPAHARTAVLVPQPAASCPMVKRYHLIRDVHTSILKLSWCIHQPKKHNCVVMYMVCILTSRAIVKLMHPPADDCDSTLLPC